MAWVLKQRVGTLGVNGLAANGLNVTPTVATTAKSTLIVVVWGTSFIGCTNISASDSAGNTYALKQHTTLNAGNVLAVLVAHNTASVAATSGTIAVAIAGASPADWFLDAYEFASNAGGRGADDTGAIGSLGATVTPSSGASGTVLGGAELIFGYSVCRSSASPTPSTAAPWTQEATAGGDFTSISAWLTGVGIAQFVASGSGTYTNNAVTFSGAGTITVAGALVLVIKEQFDYSEALTTQPTQQTALAEQAGAFRTRVADSGPATQLGVARRQILVSRQHSVTPATTLAVRQAAARAPSTAPALSTTVAALLGAARAPSSSATPLTSFTVARSVPRPLTTSVQPSTSMQFVSPTSVINALAGLYGPVVISHRLEWRDRGFRLLGDLTPALLGGEVDLDNDQAVARTCTLQLDGNALPAGWLTTPLGRFCVALWADLLVQQQTVSFCLGLFGLDRPQRTYGSGNVEVWDVQGADLTAPLAATLSNQPYSAAQGANTLNLVKQICDAQGLRRSIPVVSAVILPVAVSWPPQTSWLSICNDLLFGLNYYPLWADAFGVLTSRPRLDPFVEPVAVWYSATVEPCMVVEPFTRGVEAQIEDNQCTVAVDDPARGPTGLFSSTRTNNDPSSPVSVANAGAVTPLDLRGGSTPSTKAVPDRITANAIAAQELREAAGRAQPATLRTLPDPRRGNREFYQLSIDTRELGSHWRVSKWRYTIPSQSGSSGATPPGSTGLSLGGSAGGTATPMEHGLEAAVPVLIA